MNHPKKVGFRISTLPSPRFGFDSLKRRLVQVHALVASNETVIEAGIGDEGAPQLADGFVEEGRSGIGEGNQNLDVEAVSEFADGGRRVSF
ncbi:unnamed protein product [Linum trigynum]|uniref:Uncharacterized protein n=1 Tax=Linum trigynum TaxID=586398 RepID=A0AAV2EQ83_9ROSI